MPSGWCLCAAPRPREFRRAAGAAPRPCYIAGVRVGLISDTHDRPHGGVFRLFDGVDAILHAGDVCSSEVLTELEALAPVTAVHGNCCSYQLQQDLPASTIMHVEGWRIFLQHDIGTPDRFRPQLDILFPADAERPHIVMSGHSHQHWWTQVNGVWFVNPGSAGPARFKSRPTAAILTVNGAREPQVTLHELESC